MNGVHGYAYDSSLRVVFAIDIHTTLEHDAWEVTGYGSCAAERLFDTSVEVSTGVELGTVDDIAW